MKKILLTGGSGFIGRNIRESFLSDKYTIIAPGSSELDLKDTDSVGLFFKNNKVDIVIHGACKPGHRNANDSKDIFLTNTHMFFNLEKYSDQYEKMLVLGSGAIYDAANYLPMRKEEDFTDFIPSDEHGFGKYVCGKYMEAAKKNIIDLRIFGIFGKYEDYAIRFISNMICKTMFDLPLTMNQNRRFSYLYIDDLMPILDFFISNQTEHYSYNITPDETVELLSLTSCILKSGKKDLPVVCKTSGLGKEYSGDNSRLKAAYPDIKFTPVNEAIGELYTWYSNHKSEIDKTKLLTDK